MKSRIFLFASLLFVVWCMIVVRGFQLQVLPQDRLNALKEKRFQRTIHIDARRGDLIDRKGAELAVSVPRYSLFADPSIITEHQQITDRLTRHLGLSRSEVSKKIRRKGTRFVWLARKLSKEDYDKIQSWGIRGLGFKTEPVRIYPNAPLMSSVLGLVGSENKGLEGLERELEGYLSGDEKVMVLQRDARGRPLIENGWLFLKNEDGKDVRLTVDRDLQHFVEQALGRAVSELSAQSASAVVVDVETAEIRAMANIRPQGQARRGRNMAVVDAYEPGSTLKSMLVAAALEEKIVQPNTVVDTGGGSLRIGKRVIREASRSHQFESLTVTEVLAKSSNVGTANLAFMLGAEKYRDYLTAFGFGGKTGFSFPGEAAGILHPLPWRKEHLASVSFGHAMTSTLLQMAGAYTVLASGGMFRPLKIVEGVRDPVTGQWESVDGSQEPRRVVSQSVADTLSLMLAVATSEGGTGTLARVPGFAVAGKTGTAQKVDPNGRGYLDGAYISSFAGYFPLPNPRFVIVVSVDEPQDKYYGSSVAAPLFAQMASFLTRHEELVPRLISKSHVVRAERDIWDYQQAQQQALQKLANPPSVASEFESQMMPDLKGKSLREVKRLLSTSGATIEFRGSGTRVKSASPSPGVELSKGQRVRVIF